MPSSNMGYTACQMLISAIKRNSRIISSMEFKYPCVLKVRGSTKDIRAVYAD